LTVILQFTIDPTFTKKGLYLHKAAEVS